MSGHPRPFDGLDPHSLPNGVRIGVNYGDPSVSAYPTTGYHHPPPPLHEELHYHSEDAKRRRNSRDDLDDEESASQFGGPPESEDSKPKKKHKGRAVLSCGECKRRKVK